MAILEASPVPNQMITMGASAMIGIEPSAMMNGCTTRDTKREYQSERPSTVPRMLPSEEAEQRLQPGDPGVAHTGCRPATS